MEGRTIFGNQRESLGEVEPVSFSPTTGSGFVRPFSTGVTVAGRVEPRPETYLGLSSWDCLFCWITSIPSKLFTLFW